MQQKSSYLQYLPPVLWDKEPPSPAFSLGTFLCAFEKILTGLDDDVPTHESIRSIINRLPELVDPETTPAGFLPWLASWVGLTLPDDWYDYQTGTTIDDYPARRTVGEMVSLYRQRGSRQGLARMLEVFTAGPLEPRIVIDDGSKLLAAPLGPDGSAALFTLQAQGPLVRAGAPFLEGLVRPQCIAVGVDHSLFVGDAGYSFGGTTVPARLWRLTAAGEYPFVNSKPQPLHLIHNPDNTTTEWTFQGVTAVIVRNVAGWQVWFLDGQSLLYLLTPSDGFRAQKYSPANPPWPPTFPSLAFTPVAMTADPATNDLVFLDRGADKASPAKPGLVVLVDPDTAPKIRRVALQKVVEPLSLLALSGGDYLIGDGGKQQQQSPPVPADLTGNLVRVHVDRSNDPQWTATETVLLDPLASPLVSPTGLALGPAGDVFVLDTGLKPERPPTAFPFRPDVAKPAGLYRTRVDVAQPSVTFVSQPGRLVYPQALAVASGVAYVCDAGMPQVSSRDSTWRVRPHGFGVIVHFPNARLPQDAGQRVAAMSRVLGTVRDIVNGENPAQTYWELFTESPS